MGKVIMFNLITLDGYFEGENKWDIGWHQVDDEFNEFSIEQLNHTSGLIFGRVTYQGMASYWPSPAAIENDPLVATKMNSLLKYVFSKTLEKAEWNNTQLIKGDAVKELTKLKEQAGNDLFLFGSAELASTFIQHKLIDEYRLIINPIVLGKGGALFKENNGRLKLKLIDIKSFHNGNVLLYYQPDERQLYGVTLNEIPLARAEMLIRKPVAKVFEAFVNPDITSNFWFTKSEGRLESGKHIRLDWEVYGVSTSVLVKTLGPEKRILLEWGTGEKRTTVERSFEPRGIDTTIASITNLDFSGDCNEVQKETMESAAGFALALAVLKSYLEYGIELNLIADRFPDHFVDLTTTILENKWRTHHDE